MTGLGTKSNQNPIDLRQDNVCSPSHRISRRSSGIRIECEQDHPPRLCRNDLLDPCEFHRRLVDWLMKQR